MKKLLLSTLFVLNIHVIAADNEKCTMFDKVWAGEIKNANITEPSYWLGGEYCYLSELDGTHSKGVIDFEQYLPNKALEPVNKLNDKLGCYGTPQDPRGQLLPPGHCHLVYGNGTRSNTYPFALAKQYDPTNNNGNVCCENTHGDKSRFWLHYDKCHSFDGSTIPMTQVDRRICN